MHETVLDTMIPEASLGRSVRLAVVEFRERGLIGKDAEIVAYPETKRRHWSVIIREGLHQKLIGEGE